MMYELIRMCQKMKRCQRKNDDDEELESLPDKDNLVKRDRGLNTKMTHETRRTYL